MVASCSSGRELTDAGFVDDVTIASEINVCDTVAVLTDAAFTAADWAHGAYDYLGSHLCQEDG
jgi:2-phosphosulfolactate phosphatase